MADQNQSFEVSSPTPFRNAVGGGLMNNNDLDMQNAFKIDNQLLVDICCLSIGPVISEGHYSIVYEGLYKSAPVAVKVIQPEKSSNVSPERQEKFKREVVMLSRVQHDNVVKFIGAVMEPTLMIITEFMRGGTLQKYLWSVRPNCPDLKLAISFALGISRAMTYLHAQGIIHRDLKPSNLLLTEDRKNIKVADFGLARDEAVDEMTTEAGTYRWMAPELFSVDPIKLGVKKHYNHKVDVYSFSMILWELLTNRTPFKGRSNVMVAYAAATVGSAVNCVNINLRPIMDDIPKDIAPLLQSCWSKDPAERPEFTQITDFLASFLCKICTLQTTPSILFEAEHSEEKVTEDSPGSDCLMDRIEEKKKKTRRLCCILSCFDDCL